MAVIKAFKALLGLMRRLFFGRLGDGWRITETRNGRVAVKNLRMQDGTLSCAGIGKGFIVIYAQTYSNKDFRRLCPMHVLFETSIENLTRFYCSSDAHEIHSVYSRFN